MNYDFKKTMRKIEKALFAIKHWILASCRDGNVSARTISIVVINGEIYFQTDKNTLKYHQIKNNNRVALCSGNCNIEGTAIDRRHPSDKKTRYSYYSIKRSIPRHFKDIQKRKMKRLSRLNL